MISQQRMSVSGVVPAGFTTTVLPASNAGPSLLPIRDTGKFQGTMEPQTPRGLRSTRPWRPVSSMTALVRMVLAIAPRKIPGGGRERGGGTIVLWLVLFF